MKRHDILHVFTVNHKHAPTEVRESAHLGDDQAGDLMDLMAAQPGIVSCIPVSTCNRTEIYVETETELDPAPILERCLRAAGADPAVFFGEHARRAIGLNAAGHLFRVSAGLESMMLGEPQISGQLKDAYRRARRDREPGPGLLRAFQGCFRAGKRVRTETKINEGAVSVAFAAVELAKKFFESLHRQRALLLGAGETGALAARHFLAQEIGHLTVINRSPQRAVDLAAALNREERNLESRDPRARGLESGDRVLARPWAELGAALDQVDIVLSTTGAPEPVITPDLVRQAADRRCGKPLFMLDIAVPRDIHPDVGLIEDTFVFGLDDLDEIVRQNLAARAQQIPHAEKIIAEELEELRGWLADMDLRPTVAEFKAYLEGIKDKQVGFVRKKQSDEVAAAVEASLQQFIKKVLGRSVTSLKNAESPQERKKELELLRKMFSEGD